MWTRRRLLGAGLGVAGIAAAPSLWAQTRSRTTVTTGPEVEVEIADGRLRGGHSRGALAFKGVPYAGPVTGKNRFRAPPPVEPWSGVRDAMRLGPPSLQKPNSTYGQEEPGYDENCLTLNVWTPAVNDGVRRPVMFYCHGGGYATGSAGNAVQDGARLAATYDVVVVASNHRLGLLGYLYLADIGGEEYAQSGNQSMLDIVAALRWVQANITTFGGDPDNVTVFGESGGAFKTATLLGMPVAQGLFHKVNVESGAVPNRLSREVATETALRVLKGLEIAPDELHKLYDVPGEHFVAMQIEAEQGRGPLVHPSDGSAPPPPDIRLHAPGYERPGSFGPVVDGKVLVHAPFDPVASPLAAHIPMLVGHTRDESTFFYRDNPDVFKMDEAAMQARLDRDFGDDAVQLSAVYKEMYPDATPSELYIAITSARWFGYDAMVAADRKSQQSAPVYRYRYDYSSNLPIEGTDATLRAGHATEIGMKYYNHDLPGLHGNGPGLAEASANMSALWTSFARTGKPQAPNQPDWPAYNTQDRPVMLIDTMCSVVNDPEGAARPVWESVAP